MVSKGIVAGLGLSAAAVIGGAFNLEGRYEDERATDRANAVVAEGFLANQDQVTDDISELVASVDAEISRFSEKLGAGCMRLIRDERAKSVDEILNAGTCELQQTQINDAFNLLRDFEEERSELAYWTEANFDFPDQQAGLKNVAENAHQTIDDADSHGLLSDIVDDNDGTTIDVYVEDDSVVEITNEGNKYDLTVATWFGMLAIIGIGISSVSNSFRKADQRSLYVDPKQQRLLESNTN